jgi:hypothetical protein
MLELRIFILDLMTIVDQGSRRWVLFPNAVAGAVRDDGAGNNVTIDKHFPMALFDTDDVNAGDWPILKQELGLAGDRHGFAWRLDREEILLPATSSTAFEEVASATATAQAIPDQGSARDVSWIPLLDVQVDAACIAGAPPIATNKIIARTLLTGGTFQTASFARVRSPQFAAGEVRPFAFSLNPPQNGDGARAIADRLLAIVPVDSDRVLIRTRSFDLDNEGREKITREIELRPRSSDPVVNVLLANVSPMDVPQQIQTSGLHFHLYYDLAANPPVSSQRPIPFLAPGTTGIRPGLVTLAMPAVFENAFRHPIGLFEHKICTTPRMLA